MKPVLGPFYVVFVILKSKLSHIELRNREPKDVLSLDATQTNRALGHFPMTWNITLKM